MKSQQAPVLHRTQWSICALSLGLLWAACGGNDSSAAPDTDGDGIPDGQEGAVDANGNGTPAYLDPAERAVNFPAGDGLSTLGAGGTTGTGSSTTGMTTGGTSGTSGAVGLDAGTTSGTDAGTGDAGAGDAGDGPGSDAGALDAGDDAGNAPEAGEQDAQTAGDPEPGRLAGITEAHNEVRRMVDTDEPLPELTWNPEAAAYAQDWADTLAEDCSFMHSPDPPYGENIAYYYPANGSTPSQVVQGWASEVDCWTYGTIDYPPFASGTEQCDTACTAALNTNGCGHYTQIVWRDTTSVGCGVATCESGGSADLWVCNYAPPGNIGGQYPY